MQSPPLPSREFELPIATVTPKIGEPVKRVAADATAARGVSGIATIGGSGASSAIDGQIQGMADTARKAGSAGGTDAGATPGIGAPGRMLIGDRPAPEAFAENRASVTAVARAKLGAIEIRTVEPTVKLPSNALYRVVSDPGSRYLVETDPRFTNHKNWLSSETMVAALSTAPGSVQKRLGDGFYEQQLVQQQIIEATGQRFIGDYTDNQTQYQALMANGAKVAKRFDMNVGTALTDAQMAALTEDIVWLVNREVTLADGTQQKVLVPQVYLRANAADVTGTGTLIAGDSVELNNEGALANSGTIASRRLTVITADSIKSVGTVAGATVQAEAKEDLKMLGGLI